MAPLAPVSTVPPPDTKTAAPENNASLMSAVITVAVPPLDEEGRRSSYLPPVIVPMGNSEKKLSQVAPVSYPESDFSSDSEDEEEDDDSQASIVEAGGSSSDIISSSSIPSPCATPSGGKRRRWFRKYRGMLLAILSSFIFTVSALLVKKLENTDPFNSALYKFQGALLPAIPLLLQKYYCSAKGPQVVAAVWPLTQRKKAKAFGLVLLRSFLTCNALLLHFFSLKYLPMADALTISSASPIFVSILAKVFLGEKCGYSTVIASICSLLGVVAIAKPPILYGSEHFNTDVLKGTGLAFGCTIVTALSFITLRYIRKVHYSVTTLAYGTWGSLENLAIVLLFTHLWVPSNVKDWALVVGMAFLTLFGQLAIILAMKCEQAGPVALVRTFDVLFAFMFDIAVMRSHPDGWSIAGAAVIVMAVVFVGLRKWVRSFPRGHPLRRKLRFIVW